LLLALALAACGAAAAPPNPTSPTETPRPTPTAVPGVGNEPGGGGGGSGGSVGGGSDPGGGVIGGGVVPPGPIGDPLLGQATTVVPVPGLVNQRPANVQLVRAAADDQGVSVELRWWSGVAPCNALDSITIDKDDAAKTVKLTVIEGSAKGEMACIDIAQLKATVVDLGKLAGGTWTISAQGDAKPITVEAS